MMNKFKNWLQYKRSKEDEFNKIDIKSYWEFRKLDSILFYIYLSVLFISFCVVSVFSMYFGLF